MQTERKIIGRKEIVDFPNLGLMNIPAKIDTGAYTSSIHCEEVTELELDGQKFVRFFLINPKPKKYTRREYILPVFNEKIIKNSFGQVEKRFVVKTFIRLFEEDIEIELTLADRSLMEFPLLLGRKLLKKKFVVDVAKKNQSYKAKLKK